MTRLAVLICTFGYLGYIPFAPGTIGSAAGLALYVLCGLAGSPVAQVIAIAGLFLAGGWSGTLAERYFGTIDPGQAIIDEVMGMLVTLALVPVGLKGAFIGFVLFRLLDVIKPYPASRLEHLPGGLGMMADDAMAAVYANLALRGVLWAVPNWAA